MGRDVIGLLPRRLVALLAAAVWSCTSQVEYKNVARVRVCVTGERDVGIQIAKLQVHDIVREVSPT